MSQISHKTRRGLRRYAFVRFRLAKLILLAFLAISLASCNASYGQRQNPGVVVVQATSTEVVPFLTPTSTDTPEPTATEVVVEYPSSDQDWLLNTIFPKVREAGCEPTWEASYDAFDLYVNSIVWTVDENGNPVQGLVALNFCGSNEPVAEGESNTYVGFFRIGDGVPLGYMTLEGDSNLGPTYQIRLIGLIRADAPPQYRIPVNLSEEHIGFLESAETLVSVQKQFICMNYGRSLYMENFPELYVLSSREVSQALAIGGISWGAAVPLDQCP